MLNTDDLILREETYPGLTTKGSELTNQELDDNFINIRKDIVNLSTAPNLPNYNPITIYSQFNVVTYNDKIYRFISITPQDGIEPGSDPLVWQEINLNELAHQQNSDTKLAQGTADEVTANEIRTFIDAGSGGGSTIYSANGTVVSDRIIDANGNDISFINGGIFIFASSFAPTGVNGSHTIEGYGTSSVDIVHKVSSDLGVIHEMYGDTSQRVFGKMRFGAGSIEKVPGAQNIQVNIASAGGVAKSTLYLGSNDGELLLTGNSGYDSIRAINEATNSYFTQQDNSGHSWRFGKNGNDGSIRGTLGVSLTNTEIININQVTGKWIFSQGLLNINGIPTSAAGLIAGDVWNDSGTLKIV